MKMYLISDNVDTLAPIVAVTGLAKRTSRG